VGIIMGQLMGSGAPAAEVRHRNRQVITLGVLAGACFGVVLAVAAPFFPMIYHVSDDVKHLATRMIWVYAVMMPVNAFTLSAYFTLRSGGKTFGTFIYDAGCLWLLTVPTAYILSHYTNISILPLYMICQIPDMLKCILGAFLIKQGKWVQNLTK
jgi:Na+-driven multidrug efflux pump